MNAYCYYLGSPVPSLDQTNSYKAIDEMQLFINQYPNSTRIEECNNLIDKLRAKLEIKSYELAKLYYKMSDYKAAIISMQNTLRDFPMTQHKEEFLFLICKSNFQLAENSVDSKKYERYKSTIDAYFTFIDKFASGKYAREAESINLKAKERITLYKPTN
jgi:outer membrane protein assembly factor BamD